MVLLVKPQFEAGRAEVSRGRGVITDPAIWERVQGEIEQALIDAGCDVAGWTDSPITGADGNREFLVHAITRPGRAMTRVAIVAHHLKDDARKAAMTAAAWLSEHGHTAGCRRRRRRNSSLPELAGDEPADTADLVLSLGGDGTMLRAVGMLDGAPVPLLGVNLGRLGYLTEVEVDGLRRRPAALRRRARRGRLAPRPADDARRRRARRRRHAAGQWCALNEAVVEKRTSGQTVQLQVLIDGEPFTSYAADGLIVSTPTGSTAYSLSARGRWCRPSTGRCSVTPVAPHMLFDRSLVLDPSETVEIQVARRPPGVGGDRRPARVPRSTGAIVRV